MGFSITHSRTVLLDFGYGHHELTVCDEKDLTPTKEELINSDALIPECKIFSGENVDDTLHITLAKQEWVDQKKNDQASLTDKQGRIQSATSLILPFKKPKNSHCHAHRHTHR
jgi:hypothetical protein